MEIEEVKEVWTTSGCICDKLEVHDVTRLPFLENTMVDGFVPFKNIG